MSRIAMRSLLIGIVLFHAMVPLAQAQTPPAMPQALSEEALAEQRAIQTKMRRLRSVEPRILGGIPAAPDRWPFAVAIGEPLAGGRLFQYCGGTLIADQWVLTAAHCEVKRTDKIIIGRLNLTTNEGEVLSIAEVIAHPGYNTGTHDSDAALIRLERSTTKQPVALTDSADTNGQPGRTATPIGWGLTQEAGQSSNVLLQVDVPIISNGVCRDLYEPASVGITDNMICAGAVGRDSCQGDSGGGTFVKDLATGRDQLIGVVSFGIGCGRPNFLGVYTRVSRFLPWIEERTGIRANARR